MNGDEYEDFEDEMLEEVITDALDELLDQEQLDRFVINELVFEQID